MRDLYKWISISWSAHQEVCARTRSRFRAFVYLSFKCFMCGIKDSLQLKTTPRNLVSSTTGMGVLFSRRVGSWWDLRNLHKCMHTVLEGENLNPLVSAQSASLLRHCWKWRSIIWIWYSKILVENREIFINHLYLTTLQGVTSEFREDVWYL